MEPINTWPKSPVTASVDPIVLRQTQSGTRRLVFAPEFIHPGVSIDPLRGQLRYQHKRQDESWEDDPTFNLRKVGPGEEIRITLDSGETRLLFDGLRILYDLFKEHGFRQAETSFVPMVPGYELGQVIRYIRALDTTRFDSLTSLLESNAGSAEVLAAAAGVARLRAFLQAYEQGVESHLDEPAWQTLFQRNAWALSQAMCYPVVLLGREAYVGGKKFDGKGGNFVDFLFRTSSTNNAILIEFKTPSTRLLDTVRGSERHREYRNNTLLPGRDLVGGVQQILVQRDSFRKEYDHLFQGAARKAVQDFAPRLVLVAGDCGQLRGEDQVRAFELFRRNSREVEIVTFDELYRKAEALLRLLTEREEDPTNEDDPSDFRSP